MLERSDQRRPRHTAVIEAAYRVELPLAAWIDGVARAVSTMLEGDGRSVSILFEATAEWIQLSDIRTPGFPDWLKSGLEQHVPASPEVRTAVNRLLQRGAFGRLYDFVDAYAPPFAAVFRACGVEQLSGVIASEPGFRGCIIGVATHDCTYSPRTGYRWRKIGAHVNAGLRLRRTIDSLRAEESNVVDRAEAVLTATGKVEHATGPATSAAAHGALQQALVRIDAARGEPEERSIDLWAGLVAGRWSLVEHFENSGRRYFLAYRNDPELARVRALTARELQVCSYAALGYPNKLIGYTLGLATPTVARYLERARRKLGGKAALEVLQALQHLTPEEQSTDHDPLFEQ